MSFSAERYRAIIAWAEYILTNLSRKEWPTHDASIPAGPLTFTVRHELWDGNIQDHADQGVSIGVMADVAGKATTLLRFNCFDFEKSYEYGPENPDWRSRGRRCWAAHR